MWQGATQEAESKYVHRNAAASPRQALGLDIESSSGGAGLAESTSVNLGRGL